VVFDEIAAMPWCFLGWAAVRWRDSGQTTLWPEAVGWESAVFVVGVVAAFRLFDIWKPWPVRQLQELPRGWGVTTDDLLAAVYVNLVAGIFWWLPLSASPGG
jgi:phosphatidylglycerophosphatase A